MSENGGPVGEDDVQAYVDERLDGAGLAAVEAYLRDDPDAAARVAADRQHRAGLRAQLDRKFAEPIPARLRVAAIRDAHRAVWSVRARNAAAASIIFVAGAGGGWFAGRTRPAAEPAALAVSEDASAAYRTFVVEVAHPVEVGAANEAHLLQWLSKRLGRPLAAPDLAAFGYRLMGGRLLPGSGAAAAQLMYDDASGRRLTVYVQAAAGRQTAFRFAQEGDASTFAWIDGGYGFAVTGAASRDELLPVAEAVYRRLDAGDGQPTKG